MIATMLLAMFAMAGAQGAEARCLDRAEAVSLPGPGEPEALLAGIDHLAEGELQPLEVELAVLGAHLGEEAQELLATLLGASRGSPWR